MSKPFIPVRRYVGGAPVHMPTPATRKSTKRAALIALITIAALGCLAAVAVGINQLPT
ncbi:MAG: hypothetical protein RBT81_13380 [Gammaproteobacteria bacterium]|jgi:hypothetical protein|nr:hypothetical protein [Gammaproteobacteria bacterium]